MGILGRSYWIPGSYAPTLSEKRNSFSRLLNNKGFKKESMPKVELYAIGTSTTLESNKSLGGIARCAEVWRSRCASAIAPEVRICPVAPRNRVTGREPSSTHQNLLSRRHAPAPAVTSGRAPVPVSRFSPALVENSLPGDGNQCYLWGLSVVLTWRAWEHIVHWRFHAPYPSPPGSTSGLLLEFVTLENALDTAPWASYYVPSSTCLRHPELSRRT